MSCTPHIPLFALILCVASLSSSGKADLFVLVEDDRIEGQLLNPQRKDSEPYRIEIETGDVIVVPPERVEQVVKAKSERSRYEETVKLMPPTAEGNWKMSEWCRKHHLKEERRVHLEQVIALDPQHESARRALGFVFIDDQWTTTEDVMSERGYVQSRGRWRLPQEVAVDAGKAEYKKSVGTWNRDLKLWMGQLGGRRDAEARRNLQQISDPIAAEPLARILGEQKSPAGQRLVLSILAKLESPIATQSLVQCALTTGDISNMELCVRHLRDRDSEFAYHAFVSRLSDKDNGRVNRAAACLGLLGQTEAIPALIKALVTEHKRQKPGQPGGMSTSFGRGSDGASGVSGFGFGGGGGIEVIPVQNSDVLDALRTLTGGVSFGFDQNRWQQWYIYETTPQVTTLRRDP